MLTLKDGRTELWQWDTAREISVDKECSQIHFSNKVFGRSIDVNVVDGIAKIPDVLLQTDKDLMVWAFVGTSENGFTKISKTFKINHRNKPADYFFTPPEQTSLEEIKERIEHLESIGGGGEDGFSPIVTVTQTDTGATISIQDKDGTKTAAITNGKDGKDGSDAAVTDENIKTALGYTPADAEEVKQLYREIANLGGGQPTVVSLASEMTDTTKIYLYAGTEDGYTSDDWYYYDGSAWVSGGRYGGESTGTGLSSALKLALKTFFTNMQFLLPQIAYVAESNDASTLITNAQAVVIALDASVDNSGSDGEENPDNPEVTLSGISASYYGGDVKVGTALSDLTGIVVTATYSDGSTASVTDFALSGTIAEGENTITVTYQGKTATFTVVGTEELTGVSNEVVWTDGVPYTYEAIPEIVSRTDGTFSSDTTYARSPYLYCKGASKIRIKVEIASSTLTSIGMDNAFYDENKTFITITKNTTDNELPEVGSYRDYEVPANAVYFVACKQKQVICGDGVNPPYLSYTPLK